jgi:outer membrane lipoprotein-sorting protein
MMTPIFARLFAAALALAAVAGPLSAPAEAQRLKPAQLTDADRQDVARVETYLNSLRSLSANFLQISQQGGIARGKFYLSRPGKMRFEYEPPTPVLMVADGSFLVYHDSLLKQTSYLPLSTTPVGILVRDQIKLSGDLTITGIERGPGTLRITVRQTKDPDQGALTLVFGTQPLQLMQWAVLDPQGQTTRVSLDDMRTEVKLSSDLFKFVDPQMGTRN